MYTVYMITQYTLPVLSAEISVQCVGVCIVFVGDLIPRHQQVFSSNQFFSGVCVPEPQEMVGV